MKDFQSLLVVYTHYLQGLGFAAGTIKSYLIALKRFARYMAALSKEDVRELSVSDIESFIGYLQKQKTAKGKPYKHITVYENVICVREFFRYLYNHEYLLSNPASDLNTQALVKRSEARAIFTKAEMEKFLDCIDVKAPYGARDKACFELIYSSALRLSEAINLNISDVDLHDRILTIRSGKGDKDRYVPFSETALTFLKQYLDDERKRLVKRVRKEEQPALFLMYRKRITKCVIWRSFAGILANAGIAKQGRSVHSIRHCTATHMLEAGADVRYVSELLGHERLETTVRYTHLMRESIKRMYKSYHPRENALYQDVDEKYLQELEKMKKSLLQKWKILATMG